MSSPPAFTGAVAAAESPEDTGVHAPGDTDTDGREERRRCYECGKGLQLGTSNVACAWSPVSDLRVTDRDFSAKFDTG